MATLTVTRPPEGVHDERKFKLMVNGLPVAILKQKSSVALTVPDKPFEFQVLSNKGRSRKVTVDPAITGNLELRINKKMHRYDPAIFAPSLLVFSGIAFVNSESVPVKAVSVAAVLAAASWAFYALRIKREDWILIEPHL
jgi:hypothetical protein